MKSHREDRIFDDIVSCLRFSQQQYDSKALSLAGIGCGGGWALKVMPSVLVHKCSPVFSCVRSRLRYATMCVLCLECNCPTIVTFNLSPHLLFIKAACDLSDIQCAAALAHSVEKDNTATDRAVSMNPFPGSTRGYPKTEEELRIEAEEDDRRKKEEEKASRVEEEEEDGVEVNLEEGAGKIESADLRELMKMSGLAEEDEAEKEKESDYSDMEKYRDKLDADVAFRATEIVTGRAKRGAKCIAGQASLTLRDLARLEPCGVLAVCPSMGEKDVEHVGR
jgi:hypothetical protein